MNYTISFQERARLGLERLSKQSPVTLAMARKQVQMLKAQSKSVSERYEKIGIKESDLY